LTSILRQKESHQKDTRKPTKEYTSKKLPSRKSFQGEKFCLPTRVAVAIFLPLNDVDAHDWLPRFGSLQLLAENEVLVSCSKNPTWKRDGVAGCF